MSDSNAQPEPGNCSERSSIEAKFTATASSRTARLGTFERKCNGTVELNFPTKSGCTPWDVFATAIQTLAKDWDVGEATHFKISFRLSPVAIQKMRAVPMDPPVIAP